MIFWFSGTGNSKYAAQRMAEALNEPMLCMNDRIQAHDTTAIETGERLVIVTPTYASGREAGVVRHDLRQRDRQRRSL